ncbi:alpha-hydroxy-acid oxidizing protein [Campylobacter pinnipediorum]|uniref:alpha-hydroxy-acid oxidizing protein n=1 Tax=Campylobacter pinnipediorum TaxID=1965231 RepID=UPI00099595DC|nr:alpha-hydroxy-acid oxidizing protein [Campylobacter pinnipediorum]AQW81218.1 L-lactate oxidase [Campylobacter pinnipediorum subsp. pinnipediorum]
MSLSNELDTSTKEVEVTTQKASENDALSSRRKFLSAAGLGLGVVSTLPFVSTPVLADEKTTTKTKKLAKTAYGASTAEKEIKVVSLERLQDEVKKVVPKAGFEFVSGAAGGEWTMHENRRAFDDYRIAPKRLVGLSWNDIDTSTKLLGLDMASPIMVAPMGAHAMIHEGDERATAKGAGLANTLYCSSGASNATLEQIANATNGPKWFQLYYNNDEGVTKSLLTRAKNAGYSAIILTADALGPGQPENFIAMGSPFRPDRLFGNHDPKMGGKGNFFDQKTALTTKDIEFIKSFTGLPVIVKGILRPDDAKRFVEAGADAIQVSNHGGRQIDGVPASMTALPAIAKAVNKKVPIILDGGVRRGIDIVRAIAMGANAVAVGRPMLYGLGLGGSLGVKSVIEFLNKDLVAAMILSGAGKLADLNPSYIDIVGENAKFNKYNS